MVALDGRLSRGANRLRHVAPGDDDLLDSRFPEIGSRMGGELPVDRAPKRTGVGLGDGRGRSRVSTRDTHS